MDFKNEIMDELNVKDADYISDLSPFLEPNIKLKHSVVDPKYGSLIKDIEKEINNIPPGHILEALKAKNTFNVVIHGRDITLTRDDIEINYNIKEGFCIEGNEQYTIVLKTSLTDQLIKEGIVRDFVRNIQYLRKKMDLSIDENIIIYFISDKELIREAIKEYQDYIKTETLATDIKRLETKMLEGIVQKEIYCQGRKVYVGISHIRNPKGG